MSAPAEPVTGPAPGAGRPRRALALALVAVIATGLLVAGGGLAVVLGVGRTSIPTADSVDAGFARDMSRHHMQAVDMANLVLARTQDAEVRLLAFDISATQTNQAGRMQGWLSLWGLPVSGDAVMSWMKGASGMPGMPMGGGAADGAPMPGMATATELAELRTLPGQALDVRFLQLMIRHHQGGQPMAQYGQAHAAEPAVRTLARSIAQTQAAEAATMTDMLRARGGTPLPAP